LRLIQTFGILPALICVVLWCPAVHAANPRTKTTPHKAAVTTHKIAATTHHSSSASSQLRRSGAGLRARHAAVKVSARSAKKASHPSTATSRGQRGIDNDRAREIQVALIREKYLDGEPSGVWDQSTRDAMTRFQSNNGWQTKLVPDSRALIKLGLGPTHAGLIDPSNMDPAVLLPDSARGMRPGGASQQR